MRTFAPMKGWLVLRLSVAAALVLASRTSRVQVRPAETAPRQKLLLQPVVAAVERTHHTVRYDPAYVRIPHRGGDVPADTGVRTDEVIRVSRGESRSAKRSTRRHGAEFSAYPRKWGGIWGHPEENND